MFRVWMETMNSRCVISLIGIDGDFGFTEFIAKPDQFLPRAVSTFERRCIAVSNTGLMQRYTSFDVKLLLPPETPFFLQLEAPTSSMTVQNLQQPGSFVVRSGTRKFELRSLKNGLIASEVGQREVPFDFAAWVRNRPRRTNF